MVVPIGNQGAAATDPGVRIWNVGSWTWLSAQILEESCQVSGDRRWFFSRGEVSAARRDCPALDVVQALQIRARRLALGNGLVRENAEGRGVLM
jgi:hypothetical protein